MRKFMIPAAAALLAGCSATHIDTQRIAAVTTAPFSERLGFNKVSVPSGSPLYAAWVDDKPAFCTVNPAWFAILEARTVCFTDAANSGYLTRYYVADTLAGLTNEAHIPYIVAPATTTLR